MNISIKLLTQILEFMIFNFIFEILKNNQQKYVFFKANGIFSEFFKTRNICQRTMSGVYVGKISGRYLEN